MPISCIYFNKYKLSKKEIAFLVIINLICLAIPFLIVSRQLILTTIVITGFTIMSLYKKHELKMIIFIVCLGLITWILISQFRNQSDAYLKKALNIQDDCVLSVSNMQIYMYVAINYDNFNLNVDELPQHYYGTKSLFPLFAFTGLKFIMSSITNAASSANKIIQVYNTYPIILTPYLDFGGIGIVIYMLLIGYISCFVEKRKENEPVNILLKSLIKYALLFSFFTSYFANAAFWFYVIILLIGKLVFFSKIFIKSDE